LDVIIRKLEFSDLNDLSDLFVEFTGKQSDLNAMKTQMELISRNDDYLVVVASLDNKVIGTAMAIKCLDLVGNCNSFLLVENVVVSSVYRGRGIGKLIMNRIEEFAVLKKCNYIVLVSGNNRSQAHKFYEDLGYSKDNQGFKKRLLKQI
jgi:GNAT superfamily N-acetyltransferase